MKEKKSMLPLVIVAAASVAMAVVAGVCLIKKRCDAKQIKDLSDGIGEVTKKEKPCEREIPCEYDNSCEPDIPYECENTDTAELDALEPIPEKEENK